MSETPALAIEYRPTAALMPYARNARTHNDAQVAQIAASIKEFGFTNPVLIDAEGGIIAGHGRVLAARKLQLGAMPCIVLAGLTPAQKRAYVLADNKLALNAGWDWDMLAVELDEIGDSDIDMGLTGFTAKELKDLVGDPNAGVAPQLGPGLSYKVIVDCADEKAQVQMMERFEREGLKCRPLMI